VCALWLSGFILGGTTSLAKLRLRNVQVNTFLMVNMTALNPTGLWSVEGARN
jgi:hypothetical protein